MKLVSVSESVLDEVLWSESQELDQVPIDYFSGIADRTIREDVFAEKMEGKEVEAPPVISR